MASAKCSCFNDANMTAKCISPAAGTAAASPPNGTNSRQRILVVDDDPLIRRINAEVLVYSGYQVDTADNGQAAWDALQQNNYDLMVTDNEMPKLSGIELIEKIKGARMELPVIMATGTLPEDKSTKPTSFQPAITLHKPYTFEELVESVKEILFAASAAARQLAPPPNWPSQRAARTVLE
jgi:DNA-binding response OmpR family regulator